MESLIKSGSMDGLGPNRATLFASIAVALQLAEQSRRNEVSGQDDLFGLGNNDVRTEDNAEQDKFTYKTNWDDETRLTGEKDTLGFYLQGHPIIRYENELEKFISCSLKNLRTGLVTIAGFIHRIRTRSGIRGRMAEIILDDRTARANITVYSDKFNKYRDLLVKDSLIIVKGEVVDDDYFESGYSVIAQEINDIDYMRNNHGEIRIKLSGNNNGHADLDNLKKILAHSIHGKCKVKIYYNNPEASCALELGDDWRINLNDNVLDVLKNSFGKDNVLIEYHI